MKGYHFLSEDLRLGYGDGRIVEVGKTLSCEGEIKPCFNGMHASKHAFDALRYAPGPILCRVDVCGELLRGDDKFAGRTRTVIAMADASSMLRKFARMCALDVTHLWDCPAIIRRYLKTGDESIRNAARAAARAATWNAAWDAVRDAAKDAAWDAAGGATWAAARAATWRMPSRAAAWAVARKKQRRRFARMCNELLRKGGEG